MAAPPEAAGHLLFIYVTEDGSHDPSAAAPAAASSLAELAQSAEVRLAWSP